MASSVGTEAVTRTEKPCTVRFAVVLFYIQREASIVNCLDCTNEVPVDDTKEERNGVSFEGPEEGESEDLSAIFSSSKEGPQELADISSFIVPDHFHMEASSSDGKLTFTDPAILSTTDFPEQVVVEGVHLIYKQYVYVRVGQTCHLDS